jgi:hypothetical protein
VYVRELIAEREWLTVFLLPAYSPDLSPVEWVWAHVKRSLANLAVVALDRIEVLVRNRLKRLQYRPHTLDGFITGTSLNLVDRRGWRRSCRGAGCVPRWGAGGAGSSELPPSGAVGEVHGLVGELEVSPTSGGGDVLGISGGEADATALGCPAR